MTFRSVYNEEQWGFGPLRAPQLVSQASEMRKYTKGPIYTKLRSCQVR